jgi:hypothetical protein
MRGRGGGGVEFGGDVVNEKEGEEAAGLHLAMLRQYIIIVIGILTVMLVPLS